MTKKPRDNVIRFPVEGVRKFGFKKARKARTDSTLEREGQLSLFGPPAAGEVVTLPTGIGPFEEALLYDERGDKRAEERYHQAVEAQDHVADAWCNLGIIACERGETAEALERFAQSLATDPRHFEAHYNMANLYFEIGDLTLARTHYGIAAQIDPEFPHLYFNLGLVNAMSERFEDAIEALTTYEELTPPDETRMASELLLMLRQSIPRKPHHN